MPKILWAISTIGTGHVYRNLRIAEELRKTFAQLDIIFVSDSTVAGLLRSQGINCLDVLEPVNIPVHDGWLDVWGLVKDWLAKEKSNAANFAELLRRLQPDLVIADELPSLATVNTGLKIPSALITDFLFIGKSRPFLRNFLFNASLSVLEPLLIRFVQKGYEQIDLLLFVDHPYHVPDNWRSWACHHLVCTGPIVRTRKNDEARALRVACGIKSDQKLVSVTIGGSAAGRYLLETACRALPLIQSEIPETTLLLFTGARLKREDLASELDSSVIVKEFEPDLIDYMAASDLVICNSGLTTLNEIALLAHVPAITSPIGNHWEQQGNARVAEAQGFATRIERQELTPASLARAATRILSDSELRQKMVEATYRVEGEKGAEVAARHISALLDR